ncbi:MAG: helix-turn-helix transcriptional regulator [Rhodobacteraceae bacterium]|jgi:DNA-binding CsgD family transcriptional regulator|nr:helix-turn-helix transcriptional regulator [Paracoccaceae bacterium]
MIVLERGSTVRPKSVADGFASLTRHLGSERFDRTITEIVESKLMCKHMTVFSFRQNAAPKVISLVASERVDAVRRASEQYVRNYWQCDPTNLFNARRIPTGSCAVLMNGDEVTDSDYRRDCYTQTGISQRLSLITETEIDIIKISFHRAEAKGEFSDSMIDDLVENGEMLASVLLRHHEIVSSQSSGEHPERFEKILAIKHPQLSHRERQVCSLIAIGMSSEAIALTLNISINTVLTFRRRAYARLSISTQNELMRLLYRELLN